MIIGQYFSGSGHDIPVLGRDDLDVAFKSDSAENLSKFHTSIAHLKDVLRAPRGATSLVSLHGLVAHALE